ncbi:hypothetical protein MTO96_044669, partial [Rhipicephalus appendiculatus]
ALWSLSFLSVVVLNATYGLLVGILLGLMVIFLELKGHKGSHLHLLKPDVYVPSKGMSRIETVKVYRFGTPLCFATYQNIVADFEHLFEDEKRARKAITWKLHDA